MVIKETIAFIGIADEMGTSLINKLAQQDYPMLLIANNNQFTQLVNQIKYNVPGADIGIIDCAKEGCWEADIIALLNSENIEKDIFDKIEEVATQKIVILISSFQDDTSHSSKLKEIQKGLPNSKVVQVFCDAILGKVSVVTDNKEVALSIGSIFENLGYTVRVNPFKYL